MTLHERPKLPRMQSAEYLPKEGEQLTIRLEGEVTRGMIRKVIDGRHVICELLRYTTSREHGYKKGDMVAVRLVIDGLNQRVWQCIDERELKQPPPNFQFPQDEVPAEPERPAALPVTAIETR